MFIECAVRIADLKILFAVYTGRHEPIITAKISFARYVLHIYFKALLSPAGELF
jgi:hypothetical protein